MFDLDPSRDGPADVWHAAIARRDLLEELTLRSWVKTSGSKGFHLVVPLDGKTPMGEVARFAGTVGTLMVKRAPDRFTQEFSKADRDGRIYMSHWPFRPSNGEDVRRRGRPPAARFLRSAGLQAYGWILLSAVVEDRSGGAASRVHDARDPRAARHGEHRPR